MDKVIIFDTTLRDGDQTPKACMTRENKIKLAQKLEELGVDVIEAGFPANSQAELEIVAQIAQEIKNATICALARAKSEDITAATNALKNARHPRIHVFISSSDIHIKHQLKKDYEQVIDMAEKGIRQAKNFCADVEFSAMDATRTKPSFLYRLIEAAIKAGATTINVPDTVGYTTPEQIAKLIKDIKKHIKDSNQVIFSVHCHNDLGMATANSLAGIKAGARQAEVCVNGIGERAGNAALEEVVMALHTRQDFYKLETNINTTQIYPVSLFVQNMTGISVQPNKAIVGENAFLHESGVHQDGVLKKRDTYEIMDPQAIGWPKRSSLSIGKTSGRAGIYGKIEQLGFHLEEADLSRVYDEVKNLVNQGKTVSDQQLQTIIGELIQEEL